MKIVNPATEKVIADLPEDTAASGARDHAGWAR